MSISLWSSVSLKAALIGDVILKLTSRHNLVSGLVPAVLLTTGSPWTLTRWDAVYVPTMHVLSQLIDWKWLSYYKISLRLFRFADSSNSFSALLFDVRSDNCREAYSHAVNNNYKIQSMINVDGGSRMFSSTFENVPQTLCFGVWINEEMIVWEFMSVIVHLYLSGNRKLLFICFTPWICVSLYDLPCLWKQLWSEM